MVQSPLPERLSIKVRTIEDVFARDGVSIRSMKKAGSLELMPGVNGDTDPKPSRIFEIERLENIDVLAPRFIPRIAPPQTGFRYFLDGTQKTLPLWRFGAVPIVISFAVVGVLERDEAGEASLLPGSLREEHIWIIPRKTNIYAVDKLIHFLLNNDETVIDPIDPYATGSDLDYRSHADEFGKLVDLGYSTAGRFREALEQRALGDWKTNPNRRFADGWMVVDGRLQGNHEQCIGLVKNLLTQHVRGQEAEILFDLEQGHRTTAFRIRSDGAAFDEQQGRTHWYMRFWNADGFDARHALIRIEAPHHIDTTAEIDEIASWILAERLPRPTDDPRWPTLLYPIHLLERMLKRKLAGITTGWPS